jgi:hypothetical protein
MSDDPAPDPTQNPYHPYEETDRYRAFRDGWVAHRRQRPRTAVPVPLSQPGRALAWLDGWAAATGEGSVDRRRPTVRGEEEAGPSSTR